MRMEVKWDEGIGYEEQKSGQDISMRQSQQEFGVSLSRWDPPPISTCPDFLKVLAPAPLAGSVVGTICRGKRGSSCSLLKTWQVLALEKPSVHVRPCEQKKLHEVISRCTSSCSPHSS
eukprot:90763-Hanusia_phi.AAC.1